jgi:FtsZ-binding cell division protein ZapB
MDALEAEIREITKTLAQIDIDLGKKLPRDEVKYLRNKEERLRTEKEQLRRKEEQLRRKEEQLRDEQLILLKAGEEWHLAWQA